MSARRAVLRWRALGAATQDTAELTPRVDEPLPVPSDESDSDVVVPRPPASPSRPGFKSQARRVVIASRFARRAREAAALEISPRPGPPPAATESLPPESPSAPPRLVATRGPPPKSWRNPTWTPRHQAASHRAKMGYPKENEKRQRSPGRVAGVGRRSVASGARPTSCANLRDAASRLSKTPRAERADDAVRDAVARAVESSTTESQRMTQVRASAPEASRAPSSPRVPFVATRPRPESGAVGRAAAMLKGYRTDGEKRRRRTNARRRRTRGRRRRCSTRRRANTAPSPRLRFRRLRCRRPEPPTFGERRATLRLARIYARRRTAAEAPRRRAHDASRG